MDADTSFFVAVALLPLSGVFFWAYRRAARRLHHIQRTPTVACRDLPGLGASIVEVKGAARVPAPLYSDLCHIPCVAFRSVITEHWTTTETTTDSEGRTHTVTRHHSEVRYHNERRIPFEVVDESGRATVDPTGAEIDMISQQAGPAPAASPAYGISPIHWNGSLSYDESVLPVEQVVYVLGQVTEEHALAKPIGVDAPFIISHHPEERLISGARWSSRIFVFLASAGLVGAFGCAGRWWQLSGGRFPWD